MYVKVSYLKFAQSAINGAIQGDNVKLVKLIHHGNHGKLPV